MHFTPQLLNRTIKRPIVLAKVIVTSARLQETASTEWRPNHCCERVLLLHLATWRPFSDEPFKQMWDSWQKNRIFWNVYDTYGKELNLLSL